MGNHGILIMGENVGDTFNLLYNSERAAMTYNKALQTGKSLRIMPD